jgi:hypothetical protein
MKKVKIFLGDWGIDFGGFLTYNINNGSGDSNFKIANIPII